MNQFFIAIILVLGLGSWYLYNENQTLTANNFKLEVAVEEQKQTIQSIKDNLEKRSALASYFVASLELAKEGRVSLRQENFKDKIYLISKTNL